MNERCLRVLVADDNEINQLVVKQLLEHVGFEAEAVSNGREVIGALGSAHYDLIIMDCQMPVMDGFAATRAIRAASTSRFDPDIPILALTAFTNPEDQSKCLEAGMTGYLTKPVVAEQLFDWLECHLGSYSGPESAEPAGRQESSQSASKTTQESRATGDPGLSGNLSSMLSRDARNWVQELTKQREAREFQNLAALAHQIRGTADILGFRELSEIARKLEETKEHPAPGESFALVDSLIEVLDGLIHEIGTNA